MQFSAALAAVCGESARGTDPQVRAAGDARFGDYQCNVAMSLAKSLGAKPRELAERLMQAVQSAFPEAGYALSVAGPGFINIRLEEGWLAGRLAAIGPSPADADADRVGVDPAEPDARDTVVIDYSSPNVAKQMHVGHLRSTIIGDALARVLRFAGHAVVAQNHLGDWGTQFGMVILGMWHMFAAQRRGEPVSALTERIGALKRAQAAGPAELQRALQEIAQRHQQDIDADPNGAAFHAFLRDFRPQLDDLLPAYQFVNAVEEAAAQSELAVVSRPDGQSVRLAAVSNHVVAMLQRGSAADQQEIEAWKIAIRASLDECGELYRRLGVLLTDADVRGESFFHAFLPGVLEELQQALSAPQGAEIRAVYRADQGAACVFLEQADGSPAFKGPTGGPLPMIIRKSDGAYLYSTTDLAAALYRIACTSRPVALHSAALAAALRKAGGGLGGTRVLYVVGSPQKLHFEMLFAVVRALAWDRPAGAARAARLQHVMFGSVLGDDRKMLRTRTGGTVRLVDLLDEAEKRARELVEANDAKRAEMGLASLAAEEKEAVARGVGIAAVKYADLCQNRMTDYVFSWDKMLAMQGNTAPYLLYAYARIQSIYRRGAGGHSEGAAIVLREPAERALALRILQFGEALGDVVETLLPNLLCDYLHQLAAAFMVFYENCPVLNAPDAAQRGSRLRLCELTARALRAGLRLLGIDVLERM